MACYFRPDKTFIMRRGDTAKFYLESDDIPFDQYDYAYFTVIDLETLNPVLPELRVPTKNSGNRVEFKYTAEETEILPQPTEEYDVYGYTIKFGTNEGDEDTYVPETTLGCGNSVVTKPIPKVLFYPKVNEGPEPTVEPEIEEP